MVGSVPTVLLAFAFVSSVFAAFKIVGDQNHFAWGWASIMFLIAALLLGGPLQALLLR